MTQSMLAAVARKRVAGGGNQLLTNLVSYWKMDEASGDALDAHGTNDLTDQGSTGTAAGKVSTSRLLVRGSTNYFSHADNASLQTGDIDFTIGMWVYPTDTSVQQDFVAKWGNAPNEYILFYTPGTGLRFFVNGSERVVNSAALSNATWYYVVIYHDAANDEVGVIVNNGTPSTAAYSGGITAGPSTFAIGANAAFTTNSFDGRIDEVGFWKRMLTSQEWSDLYNSGSGLAYSNFQ